MTTRPVTGEEPAKYPEAVYSRRAAFPVQNKTHWPRCARRRGQLRSALQALSTVSAAGVHHHARASYSPPAGRCVSA